MTAKTYTAEYLAEAIADELQIAKLLGYGNIVPPVAITPNCWIFGTHGGETSLSARLATGPLPKWRREWAGAGELIGRCNPNIVYRGVDPEHIGTGLDYRHVEAYFGDRFQHSVITNIADHPTKDDAIRAAICKAAIQHLTAERARQNERAPA